MMVVVMMMLLIPPQRVMMVMVMVMVMVVVNELHVRIPARTLVGGRGRVSDPQEGEGIGYGVE
jgi:hypothetical protein